MSHAARPLPMSRAEMAARGWRALDVLFITGDAYIDHPAFGAALLGRVLEAEGYRVGVIAQPDLQDPQALTALGRPRLFAAVTSGAMDSMVNHYTATRRRRSDDAYTPGGLAGARPDRAILAYTAAVKAAFKGLPVVIGGIEASLRRFAHYDYWSDKIRRSVLPDSKADLCVYGMGEVPLVEIARRAAEGEVVREIDIRGTARMVREVGEGRLLPSYEATRDDPMCYVEATRIIEREANPYAGARLFQAHGDRFVCVEPPIEPPQGAALDRIYDLPFTRRPHPRYEGQRLPAFDQIKDSVTTHRGCFGGCAFCAIAQHQGKQVQSRSEGSILREIDVMAVKSLSDVGGPTANMYGVRCGRPDLERVCRRPSCLHPHVCKHLDTRDDQATRLLEKIRARPHVRHAFIASGIRYDLLEAQPRYARALFEHHVGGLLKVAPEAIAPDVLELMRKPKHAHFESFLKAFWESNERLGRRRGVVPYFIAAHPGTTLSHMVDVALFLQEKRMKVEQVQLFTPTPGTVAACMYHTGIDPGTRKPIYVAKGDRERRLHKALLLYHDPAHHDDVREALRLCGRMEAAAQLLPRRVNPGKRSARRVSRRR
ncbi:YgiQ family radical SAM protein [Myxococcota bacterium]|nr:YgiQ family radical SAM protein [Myxococcota bacterium]MBU1433197.1 YgiQ family radical SAM protein [Myxococcota bacterium]MBU1900488.1 YgiQ family radical SAM protein [Myxococcota bacterium]